MKQIEKLATTIDISVYTFRRKKYLEKDDDKGLERWAEHFKEQLDRNPSTFDSHIT